MKAIIVTNVYPKKNNLYRNAFVHRRAKNYITEGIQVKVFVYSRTKSEMYYYDGIEVIVGSIYDFRNLLFKVSPDKILVHFLQRQMTKELSKVSNKIPIIVWVHGSEALGWYRRLFNLYNLRFLKYIISNTIQIYKLRKFVINNPDTHWVFVSNWMKNIMQKDTASVVKKSKIIPNVVDNNIFYYKPKEIEDRKKILLIRPFKSRKYATDIAVKAIIELSKSRHFKEFQISIFGDGPYFEKTLKPLRVFSNVEIHKGFLTQTEIKEQHNKHGVFLCPTRQDAQGVSMCESMSSGLVPISSNNTAIPEYVAHGETGLLSKNDPKLVANNILLLNKNPNMFLQISKNASYSIQKMCNPNVVIKREIKLIKS